MMRTTRLISGLTGVALVATMSGCSSSAKKSGASGTAGATTAATTASSPASSAPASSAPASTSAASIDYKNLLIAASDIPIPGFTRTTATATPQGQGITASYASGDGKRVVGDTIVVLASGAQAATAATASVTAAKGQITSPEVSSAPIGGGGTAIRGTTAKGALAILIWTEGRAVIVLEFDSAAKDPVPTTVIQAVATKQDSLVKAGLPA